MSLSRFEMNDVCCKAEVMVCATRLKHGPKSELKLAPNFRPAGSPMMYVGELQRFRLPLDTYNSMAKDVSIKKLFSLVLNTKMN